MHALLGLTLAVPKGELLTVVGPSGCGKTTLLRLIAGLERPDHGTISIDGKAVNGVTAAERNVAMVFQGYALYPQMNVRGNLTFGLKMRGHGQREIAERILSVGELLGIASFLERMPHELSGGEQQRVALARALVRRPVVLLLDEPLSSLDAPTRVRMRAELAGLHRRLGLTTIHVTHDQEEAMTLGTRMAVMEGGRLQQVGTPQEVYRKPANRFVAGFIGTPAINFLAAVDEPGVTLGIRPQHVYIGEGTASRPPLGPGHVMNVEPLGDAANVFLGLGSGETIVARVANAAVPRVGETMAVFYDAGQAHYFNAAGARLEREAKSC